MSDEELELLITLDDPVEAPEEDFFHHPETTNIEVRPVTPQKNGEIIE